jgi:hypothetical protein
MVETCMNEEVLKTRDQLKGLIEEKKDANKAINGRRNLQKESGNSKIKQIENKLLIVV